MILLKALNGKGLNRWRRILFEKEVKMRRVRFSIFVFMLLVFLFGGIVGFSNFENMGRIEAFHTTIATLTFSGDSSGFSNQGKLFSSILRIASVGVIVWSFVNFHLSDISGDPGRYFRFIPQDEGLVMREMKINAKSRLAGLKKIEILQKTGTVIFGLKSTNSFRLSVPFEKKIAANSRVLVMGTNLQLKDFEKKAKS